MGVAKTEQQLEYYMGCRKEAIRIANSINPNVTGYSSMQAQSTPSVDKVLKDAGKIYEWLIKEL